MANNNNSSAILASARELESKKMTFVKFENVLKFLEVCAAIGIACYGGAFASDMTGQWFYN